MVSAIDINKGRLRILEETAKLQNVDDVVTAVHADLRNFSAKNAVKSDKVLLDAPCSRLGVLSKARSQTTFILLKFRNRISFYKLIIQERILQGADLRWNRRIENLEKLATLQDELLDAASMLVKTGGILVDSTCSIDPEENEERVAAFLSRHPEFRIDIVARYVPSSFVTEEGFFFSNPVKHSLDGTFAALLVRSLTTS